METQKLSHVIETVLTKFLEDNISLDDHCIKKNIKDWTDKTVEFFKNIDSLKNINEKNKCIEKTLQGNPCKNFATIGQYCKRHHPELRKKRLNKVRSKMSDKRCSFRILKGKNIGNLCLKKTKDDNDYCDAHLKIIKRNEEETNKNNEELSNSEKEIDKSNTQEENVDINVIINDRELKDSDDSEFSSE